MGDTWALSLVGDADAFRVLCTIHVSDQKV